MVVCGMVKERVLVVGLGEVGRPLFELLRESGMFEVYGFDLDAEKMRSVGQSEDVLPPCG
jgi:UDP-N-acetyl-D-mannosaminuronate dehydrogenase